MKQYFYTDPLSAAWMAKNFEMTTYIGHLPDDIDAYGPSNWWHCQDDWRYRQEKLKQPAPRFYIHPGSLHLLEPQIGDLVTAKNDFVQYVAFVEVDGLYKCNNHSPRIVLSQEGDSPFRVTTLIQRNGIAFHWPEMETA